MYTQCPHCQTLFRIGAAELQTARGKARCGHCSQVFDAQGNLHAALPGGPTPARPAAAPPVEDDWAIPQVLRERVELPVQDLSGLPRTQPQPRPKTPGASSGLEQRWVEALTGTRPAPSQAELAADPGADQNLDELLQGFLREAEAAVEAQLPLPETALEDTAAPPPQQPGNRHAVGEGQAAHDSPPPGDDDWPRVEAPLDGWDDPVLANAGPEPVQPDDEAPAPHAARPAARPERQAAAAPRARAKADDEAPLYAWDAEDPALTAGTAQAWPVPRREAVADEELPLSLREALASAAREAPRQRRPLRALLGFFVVLLLLAALAAQLAFFRTGEVAAYVPAARPWLEAFCAHAGCELTAPRDLDRIQLVERDVRSHPKSKGALLVTAKVVNEAPFAQPYPDIRITLYDLTGSVVAERRFAPAEYLPQSRSAGSPADPSTGMAPGVPLEVELELVDPGKHAINYEFDFL